MEQLTCQEMDKLLWCIESTYDLKNPNTFASDSLAILERLVSINTGKIAQNRNSSPLGSSPTEKERHLLNLIQPHLNQALHTAQQLEKQQQEIVRLQKSIDTAGLIFLDQSGGLDWITSQANLWLQQYLPSSPPSQAPQLPTRLQYWVKDQINNLTVTNLLPLYLKQARTELTIRLIRNTTLETYILLLHEEPIQTLNESLKLLGLTDREAEVLACIIQGQTPKDIAKILSISVATARKHLENIYRKLKVQSQTEAVATALDQLGALPLLPFG
jgi:DNA-binding CsgD family transcriptional regulator